MVYFYISLYLLYRKPPLINELSTNKHEIHMYPCFILISNDDDDDENSINIYKEVVKNVKRRKYGYLYSNKEESESISIRMIVNDISSKFLIYLDFIQYFSYFIIFVAKIM